MSIALACIPRRFIVQSACCVRVYDRLAFFLAVHLSRLSNPLLFGGVHLLVLVQRSITLFNLVGFFFCFYFGAWV